MGSATMPNSKDAKMLQVALALSALLAAVTASIDYEDCADVATILGQTAQCPEGTVSVGLCTSGKDGDCGPPYIFTIIRCCREKTAMADKEVRACNTLEGSHSTFLECPDGRTVDKVCSSGKDANCGPSIFNRMDCCNDHTQVLTPSCNWIYGWPGFMVQCGFSQVITGVCSSGQDANCNGMFTGIKCCAVMPRAN